MNISVVLPAFNEEENIAIAIESIHRYLQKRFSKFEIVVVNDGSYDETSRIVKNLAKSKKNIVLVNHKVNRGYGAALRSGFNKANHDLIFYTDSDNQYNIKDLDKLLPLIKNYDIVAGYRLNRQDPLMRIFIGYVYNLFITLLFNLGIKDIDCSFKLYKKEALDKIRLKSSSIFIDAEVLIKARKADFKVAQVGVNHFPRTQGKTSFEIGNRGRIFAFVKPQTAIDIFKEMKLLWSELK